CPGRRPRGGVGLGIGRVRVHGCDLRRLEVKRRGVDAVALSTGPGAIIEDVPEMPAAVAAYDLGTAHGEAVVRTQLDRLRDGRLGEAGPAGAGGELRSRRVQHG